MIRVCSGYSAAIETAYAWLPRRIAALVEGVDFFTGSDPVFAGLHVWPATDDGRVYAKTPHYAGLEHQAFTLPRHLRRPTIVIPIPVHPATIIHELGHALDAVMRETFAFRPVSVYAATSREEAFACAFTVWLWGRPVEPDASLGPETIPRASHVFDSLMRGTL